MSRRRSMGAVVSFALTMAMIVFGAGSAVATNRPDPPTNLRVTDLHAEGMSVAWDPVDRGSEYIVRINAAVCCSTRRVVTTELHATFANLMWDMTYQVFVSAKVGFTYTDSSTITVTTPPIEGYEPPSAPASFRVTRDAQGAVDLFVWDASTGGHGTITYDLYLESPGFLTKGVWGRTTGLTIDAQTTPACNGCEYDPSQVIYAWVIAKDRRNESPPSNRVILTCCPF